MISKKDHPESGQRHFYKPFLKEIVWLDHPLVKLDNVTLTSHLAGTTSEALSRSPILLVEDILKYFRGQRPEFIVNPEVLPHAFPVEPKS